jgi:hypothetical protein
LPTPNKKLSASHAGARLPAEKKTTRKSFLDSTAMRGPTRSAIAAPPPLQTGPPEAEPKAKTKAALKLRRKRFHLDRRADLIDPAAGSDVMTTHECADFLRVSPQWLELRRCVGDDGPPFTRIGGRFVRYSRAAILEWLAKRSHKATSE